MLSRLKDFLIPYARGPIYTGDVVVSQNVDLLNMPDSLFFREELGQTPKIASIRFITPRLLRVVFGDFGRSSSTNLCVVDIDIVTDQLFVLSTYSRVQPMDSVWMTVRISEDGTIILLGQNGSLPFLSHWDSVFTFTKTYSQVTCGQEEPLFGFSLPVVHGFVGLEPSSYDLLQPYVPGQLMAMVTGVHLGMDYWLDASGYPEFAWAIFDEATLDLADVKRLGTGRLPPGLFDRARVSGGFLGPGRIQFTGCRRLACGRASGLFIDGIIRDIDVDFDTTFEFNYRNGLDYFSPADVNMACRSQLLSSSQLLIAERRSGGAWEESSGSLSKALDETILATTVQDDSLYVLFFSSQGLRLSEFSF